jgi:hypothetical protein
MNDQSQTLIRAITGPIILITVGALFMIDRFTGFGFGQTWPVLLIVIGLLKLLGGRRPRPTTYYAPPPPPPPPGPAERR